MGVTNVEKKPKVAVVMGSDSDFQFYRTASRS